MNPARTTLISVCIAGCSAAPTLAQTSIDPSKKFGWQENCGWMNWRDANGGSQGAKISATFLSGFVWAENIGWMNLGDGEPANGTHYVNASGGDAGVNILAGGELGGLAWCENVGWMNFGPFASLPAAQHARVDFAANRFRGYAWGENVGWVNLDDATHFVAFAPPCYADCDQSGALDVNDFICFQTMFAVADPYGDCDLDGLLTIDDFICFQTLFAVGC